MKVLQFKKKGSVISHVIMPLMAILLLSVFVSCKSNNSGSVFNIKHDGDGDNLKHVTQEMVAPPHLPKYDQEASGDPVVVDVTFTVQEKKMEIAPGDSIWAFTFNGTIPGPMIVCHEGDFIELTLKNPATNTQIHNIDFHASTGAEGGGDLTHVNPGEQVKLRFRATRPGVFVYHCAPGGVMTPIHIVSGMNGAIMVLPRGGLTDENGNSVKYDRAYYIAEQYFYLPKGPDGKVQEFATPQQSIQAIGDAIKTLMPTYIVFNGKVGSLVGKNAMTAKVGEKVLFITSEANNDSRFHIIGGHADLYWPGGKFNNTPLIDFETWAVPAGSAAATIYQFREPGTYTFVNHNLIEATVFGAAGQVKVEGKWDSTFMKQIQKPSPIQ